MSRSRHRERYWVHSDPVTATPCARGCRRRGSHADGCQTPECGGCLPSPAEGGPLCRRCQARFSDALVDAPLVYADLAEELRRSGARAEGHGTPTPPSIDPAVADARARLLAVLQSWCRVVCEERSLTFPEPGIGPVCLRLLDHAGWLLAQDWADEAVEEVLDALRDARWLVQPSGRRRFRVSGCPADGCDGLLVALVADTDSLLPSELVCSADREHRWTSDRWYKLGKDLHEASA